MVTVLGAVSTAYQRSLDRHPFARRRASRPPTREAERTREHARRAMSIKTSDTTAKSRADDASLVSTVKSRSTTGQWPRIPCRPREGPSGFARPRCRSAGSHSSTAIRRGGRVRTCKLHQYRAMRMNRLVHLRWNTQATDGGMTLVSCRVRAATIDGSWVLVARAVQLATLVLCRLRLHTNVAAGIAGACPEYVRSANKLHMGRQRRVPNRLGLHECARSSAPGSGMEVLPRAMHSRVCAKIGICRMNRI